MDLAGLQDESVSTPKAGPLRRLDNLSLVKTVTFRDGFAERRPQYRQFRSQRFGIRSGLGQRHALRYSRARTSSARSRRVSYGVSAQFQNIVPLHTLSPAFNPSFNTRSLGKAIGKSIRRMG